MYKVQYSKAAELAIQSPRGRTQIRKVIGDTIKEEMASLKKDKLRSMAQSSDILV
jgi:hypothetical protein